MPFTETELKEAAAHLHAAERMALVNAGLEMWKKLVERGASHQEASAMLIEAVSDGCKFLEKHHG